LSNTVLSLWSWGSNRFGQLGQGSQIKKSMPKPINYVLGYTNSEVEEVNK
jgi:alpha-tubulin suppressor-like RCC1 family protein